MSTLKTNRMDNPITPASLDEVKLLDEEVLECPYPTYDILREDAPVFLDPDTGFYVVSRYDDLRRVVMEPDNFGNDWQAGGKAKIESGREKKIREMFEEKGWLPSPTLDGRDDPNHKEVRAIFDNAFRASRIKEMDPFVEETAYRMIDDFAADGHCEWIRQFAVPFPLWIIGRQMGAREEDIWKIKGWTDAWIHRFGMMQDEADEIGSVEAEIEAQHYFQPIFEGLRKEPNDSLLSDLVNTEIPEWGRKLNDNELHAFMMADTFVGGSETTTNALSSGMMLLARNPEVYAQLKADPDKYLRNFIEEVVRLESPVQGLFRVARKDVELGGVTIPKDAIICVRYGAGNRDEAHFECPNELNLDRSNSASHLGFGSGSHHCLGAPLARRELHWGFTAMLDRMDDIRLAEGKNDLRHHPNYLMRALKELHIEFTPKKG